MVSQTKRVKSPKSNQRPKAKSNHSKSKVEPKVKDKTLRIQKLVAIAPVTSQNPEVKSQHPRAKSQKVKKSKIQEAKVQKP